MINVHVGQCGLCAHYGEEANDRDVLHQIQVEQKAPESLVEECGHPRHSALHLQVTPISGCDGFERASNGN